VAVGAAPFGEMPSNREILQHVRTLVPEAARNEPDQHVVSKVILKQFTRPWGKKGELLLASLNVRHPVRKIVWGGPGQIRQDPPLSPLCLKFGRGSVGRDRDPAA
jgi:hypothetical protein